MEALSNEEVATDDASRRPINFSFHIAKKIRRKPSVSLRMLEGILALKVEGKVDDRFDDLLFIEMGAFDSIIGKEASSNPDFWDTIGISLLKKAIELDLLQLVNMLFEHAKDAKLIIDQSEVLFLACECNNFDAVEMLLEYGADAHKWRDDFGEYETCLHIACRMELLDIMRLLIKHGVDVNAMHTDQAPALVYAHAARSRLYDCC